MVALPPSNAYAGAATEGELKQWGEDVRDFIAQTPGGDAVTELTIASGAILPTGGAHTVDTEGDASSDTLSYVQLDNLPDGALLLVSPAAPSRIVIVEHGAGGTGQILLNGETNLTLSGLRSALLLQRRGSDMVELLRNGAATQTWTAGQRGEVTTLTDAASIAINLADSNNFQITLGGNRTLANPTNAVAGQSGVIVVIQDGTGNRTLGYGTNYLFAGGGEPTLSTAAAAIDVLTYYVKSGTEILLAAQLNWS